MNIYISEQGDIKRVATNGQMIELTPDEEVVLFNNRDKIGTAEERGMYNYTIHYYPVQSRAEVFKTLPHSSIIEQQFYIDVE